MNCKTCNETTKYTCFGCSSFVCDRGLNCSIPVSENYPGWEAGKCVALCYGCDKKEKYAEPSEVDPDPEQPEDKIEIDTDSEQEESPSFEIKCASRGYHEYPKIWGPKDNEQLAVRREKENVYDPCAMALCAKIKGKISRETAFAHLTREISRFCEFFEEYGGALSEYVRNYSGFQRPLKKRDLDDKASFQHQLLSLTLVQ